MGFNNTARVAALCLLLGPLTANADLISALANLTDNGSYTTDNSTGLDWLDLSETANAAYLDAETNNPGWRYASNAEVEGLFAMFFLPGFVDMGDGLMQTADATKIAESALFISLLGATVNNDPFFTALGYYLDEDNLLRAMGTEYQTDVETLIIGPEWTVNYGGSARQAYGTYLVRTSVTVPEPGTLALLGLGLAGIGFSRRKKA